MWNSKVLEWVIKQLRESAIDDIADAPSGTRYIYDRIFLSRMDMINFQTACRTNSHMVSPDVSTGEKPKIYRLKNFPLPGTP